MVDTTGNEVLDRVFTDRVGGYVVSLENGCVGSHLGRLVGIYIISCPGFLTRNWVQVFTEKH